MMKELLISSNFKILKRYSFLFNLFSHHTLLKLCIKMQEKLYAPNQIIYDNTIQQMQDDYFLYLVVSGAGTLSDHSHDPQTLPLTLPFTLLLPCIVTIEDQFNLVVKE